MDHDDETYILLLLADSNLPTGSFVASSGFESYIKHGFSSSPNSTVITYLRDSLQSYARSALAFVSDTHLVVEQFSGADHGGEGEMQQRILSTLLTLDDAYEIMTLNHVARRASKSQGVALLTLYSKGFSRPSFLPTVGSQDQQPRESRLSSLVDQLKLMVRRGDTHGHLPICWGVLTALLGLSLERAQYLHLFLHARSLLSASVRLNVIGPYVAQQILLYDVRPLVAAEISRCKDLRTGVIEGTTGADFDDAIHGPATTWPLGEILAARHDLQHSRIFNS